MTEKAVLEVLFMKNTLLILSFLLFFASGVFAQNTQGLNCPTVDVSGGGVIESGEPMTFTASVENYDLSKLTFKWTVSGGEILEGQDTQTIKVSTKKYSRINITATVEVKGLPEGCLAMESETGSAGCKCSPVLFDEFSIPTSMIDKARLDYLVSELTSEAVSHIVIIEYFKRTTPENTVKRKIRKITDYLINQKKLEKSRFTISVGESDEDRTKFWIVPPGAENPTPEM
jgi:hypothetical protein